MDGTLLRTQLDYSFRASEQVLNRLAELPEEELRRNLGNSHGGMLDTLAHIYGADRVWLSRVIGQPRPSLFDEGEVCTIETMRRDWPKVAERWLQWADSVADARQKLAYRNLQGQPFELEVWQIVFHVVNHATYHRGQITTMLRQVGQSPVNTDLHNFYLKVGG